jgi:hypothetical protein
MGMSTFGTGGVGDISDAAKKLIKLLTEAESDSADKPWIVVCTSSLGVKSYIGPYPTAIDAMAAADAQLNLDGREGQTHYSVARLLPPDENRHRRLSSP